MAVKKLVLKNSAEKKADHRERVNQTIRTRAEFIAQRLSEGTDYQSAIREFDTVARLKDPKGGK